MRKAHATTTPVPKSTTKAYCTVILAVVSHVRQLNADTLQVYYTFVVVLLV